MQAQEPSHLLRRSLCGMPSQSQQCPLTPLTSLSVQATEAQPHLEALPRQGFQEIQASDRGLHQQGRVPPLLGELSLGYMVFPVFCIVAICIMKEWK